MLCYYLFSKKKFESYFIINKYIQFYLKVINFKSKKKETNFLMKKIKLHTQEISFNILISMQATLTTNLHISIQYK